MLGRSAFLLRRSADAFDPFTGWRRALAVLLGLWLGLAGLAAAIGQVPPPAPPARQQAKAPATSQQVPAPTARPLEKADVDAWLDGFFPYALQRGDVAGAVVVVVKDGRVLTQRGFGYADVKARKPVDPETTLFRVGSVSKLFTWTAVMQMVEQGKLDLDADVNRYLDYKIPPYQGKPVTLRNLMTHTAGFEETLRKLAQSGVKPTPLGQELKRWIPHRIFAPGTVPAYSNYGAALAGYLVERVSGEPFETYVERHIFAPVGITRASFRQPLPAGLMPNMAQGYQTGSTPPKPYEIISVGPAGSLAITGSDMARFLIAHLDNGGPLLRPQTALQMHTPGSSYLPRIGRMALGFYSDDQNGHRVIAHGGDTRFMHSNAALFPDDKVALFVSLNSVGRDGAVGPIRSLLLKQFADRYFPGPSPDGHMDAKTVEQHGAMMAGYYQGSRRAQSSFMRITALLGQQRVVPTKTGIRLIPDHAVGGGQRDWVEIQPFLWRAADTGDLLEARVVDGKVERFGTNAVSVALPVPWTISKGWLFPVLQLSFLIVLLTALAWPAGAVARRVYALPPLLTGRERLRYRLLRIASIASVLLVAGWAYAIVAGFPTFALINGDLDWLVLILQVGTPLAFLALLVLAGWTAWSAWTLHRGWFVKLWSTLLVAAALMAWWGAIAFNLLSFGNEY